MRAINLNLFFTVILCLFLSACGYHLRGSYNLPKQLYSAVYVEYKSPNNPFIIMFKRALTQAKVNVVSQREQADYIINIGSIDKNSFLQSSNTTGQVNTYALQLNVHFDITDKQGNILLKDQQAQSSQSYTINASTVVASTAQESTLLPELYRDIINQVMARISSKNSHKAFGETEVNTQAA